MPYDSSKSATKKIDEKESFLIWHKGQEDIEAGDRNIEFKRS
jgi:hypothetical protein